MFRTFINLVMLQISQLFIYPVKSLGGTAVRQAKVTATGFEHDRRWMLVDENNLFISQRECAEMALLVAEVKDNALHITHKTKADHLTIPIENNAGVKVEVTIWDDTCAAQFVGDEADNWFVKILGIKCRLVYMPDETKRVVDQRYAPAESITSFADAYPFLIIGQSSLDELNSRLTEALPIDRFRPNMVFTGGKPFEEDLMGAFTIAGINFYGVKLCGRCIITTIDQETATNNKEPLKTLASYRRKENKILFGQNLIHEGDGVITVGNSIELLKWNEDERFIVGVAEVS